MKKELEKSQEKQKELAFFLAVIWRRWGMLAIIAGLILAVSASGLAIYQFRPQYEAKLYFRIIQNLEWIELAKGLGGRQDSSNVLSMLSSDVMSDRVVADPELANVSDLRTKSNKAKTLKSMVVARSEGRGSELYSLAVTTSVPEDSALIAQKFWDKFDEEQDHFKSRQSTKLLDVLDREIASVEERLKTLETDIQDIFSQMTKSESAVRYDATGNISLDRLLELEKEKEVNLAAIETAKRDLLRFGENPVDTELTPGDLKIEIEALPDVVSADSRLRQLQIEADTINRRYASGHRERRAMDSQLAKAKTDLDKARSIGESEVKMRKRLEAVEENEQEEEELTRTLDELIHNDTFIQSRIDEELEKIASVKLHRFEFERKQEERDDERETLLSLKNRAQQIKLRKLSPFNVTRVYVSNENEAVAVPSQPVEEFPYKLIVILSAVGFALPFLLVAPWEYRIRRIARPEQMKVDVALIGEIADLPSRINKSERANQQVQVFQESVDSVSTHIRASNNGQMIRSLAVASAVTNEGKTTVATQLAVSLARTSIGRVLIIDCDLRAPTIHRVFEIDREPGIVSVLNGDLELSDVVVQSHVDNLDVLPAGILRDNPHRVLGRNKLAQLIRQAEKLYEIVILDTPPILSASESLVAAREADAALMCVMRDVSRIDVVNRACQRLLNSHVTVIGYVFSGVPQPEYAYRYGGYKYVRTARNLD